MTTEITASAATAARPSPIKNVLVCDTHPLTAVGVRALLSEQAELRFADSADSLSNAIDVMRDNLVHLLIVDKAFGIAAICEWSARSREEIVAPNIVVWGEAMSAADTMRLLHAGVRGVLRKTAELSVLVACLRTVALGRIWMEDCILRDLKCADHSSNALTNREQEVLQHVKQGLSNRDIARALDIQPGTVKIHLKHIFEKTGIRGRHALALASYADHVETNPANVRVLPTHSVAAA